MLTETRGAVLETPKRNNFFYGKLMDVDKFDLEQQYFNNKRLLINRLVIGHGVVCGLDISPGAGAGEIIVHAGVAIDGLGREIVVTEDRTVNVENVTDDAGEVVGEVTGNIVDVCLDYAESSADPVPVLVADCGGSGECKHSTMCENFRILVRDTQEALAAPPSCAFPHFPIPPDDTLHSILCDWISQACPVTTGDQCIHLARVTLPESGSSMAIDACTGRPLVYGNRTAHELLLCLAEQVAGLSPQRFLQYDSGDGQVGSPGAELPTDLVVRVVNAQGYSLPGVVVHFQVSVGGGTLSSNEVTTVTSGDPGTASVRWTLGASGPQEVVAHVTGLPTSVTFRATVS